MKIAKTIPQMRALRARMKGTVGFVPTMGYLHQGHLTLAQRAGQENDNVVVSIFVNPTQFGPREDYAAYPRDPEKDLSLLERAGVGVVFMPSAEDMYPEGFVTWVEVGGLTERLEGASRPGHFRGVATVVAKLFNVVEAHRAYFGEKDAQQLAVIQKMVRDLDINTEVVPVATVREPDGLAMSSRNVRLNSEERQRAVALSRALFRARELWSVGERSAERLRQEMRSILEAEPLARIDYVSVADPSSLKELGQIERVALASMAVWIGKTRLIDNVRLE